MKHTLFLTLAFVAIDVCEGHPTEWKKIQSPCGKILSTSLVVSNGNIFIGGIGHDGGDVFRSGDNGETWKRVTPKLRTFGVQAFAETKGGDVLMGAGGAAVLRSKDNGETWQETNRRFLFTTPRAFAIASRGEILAGWQWGIFRSTDDGTTWNQITPGQSVIEVNALQITKK